MRWRPGAPDCHPARASDGWNRASTAVPSSRPTGSDLPPRRVAAAGRGGIAMTWGGRPVARRPIMSSRPTGSDLPVCSLALRPGSGRDGEEKGSLRRTAVRTTRSSRPSPIEIRRRQPHGCSPAGSSPERIACRATQEQQKAPGRCQQATAASSIPSPLKSPTTIILAPAANSIGELGVGSNASTASPEKELDQQGSPRRKRRSGRGGQSPFRSASATPNGA